MAYANSAQREPSMEEILASIRRIIEENDAAGRAQSGTAETVRAAQSEPNVIDVDNFRDEPHDSLEPAPRQKPLLAEIQAQIAAEAAGLPPRWREALAEEAAALADRDVEDRSSYRHSSEDLAKAIENSRAAREDARALLGIPEPANTARPPVRSSEPAPAKPTEAPVAPHVPAPEPQSQPVEAAVAKRPLVSDTVGRQVSASFSELSEAFVARSRKTFDEMAEQMIAPLLRDWMENNLPTLVERLVREEIERVARSGQ